MRDIEDDGVAVLLGIRVQHVVNLLSKRAIEFLHLVLEVVLGVFGRAIKLLLFVIDGLGACSALGLAEGSSLSLKLLSEIVNFVIQSLQLGLLGRVLLLQVRKSSLPLIRLCNGRLERDDGDLGWAGGSCSCSVGRGCCLGGGMQGQA